MGIGLFDDIPANVRPRLLQVEHGLTKALLSSVPTILFPCFYAKKKTVRIVSDLIYRQNSKKVIRDRYSFPLSLMMSLTLEDCKRFTTLNHKNCFFPCSDRF
ncbi:hypothetical protein NPIL_155711 [Nephila pilipes]|uniref:Uncharacterized protein n=1 Tax=Nephila pilipes TaxID=299642 RepID=A0A8X6PC19_NEPPI|nr:hypothetical protein NPIL_155711 [Nephila pilipes]